MSDSIGSNKSSVTTGDSSLDILINQFYIAVDLYKHEDSLNWSKVNHFLYVTGGLGALLAFSLNNNLNNLTYRIDPTILVALIGIISSIGFSIAIIYGVKYLIDRKCAVIEIERLLVERGGYSLTGIDSETGSIASYRKYSPTMWVIALFPVIIGSLWVIVFISRIQGT